MNFDEEDHLELQYLAGGNIVEHPPVFSPEGRFIFVRCGSKVQVYVTSTGELTRVLDDATAPLISLELDQKQPELLLGCTSTGQLLRWNWRAGVLKKSVSLKLGDLQILTCNLMNLYKGGDTACAFVTVRRKSGKQIDWFVVNTNNGEKLEVKCGLKLKLRTPVVDVGKGEFKYIILAQGFYVYFINYETWNFCRYKNANQSLITCVRMSPSEEVVATADAMGRIFLWRQFEQREAMTNALFHWHHTEVTSLAFSPSGATLYSGGHETVMVKWPLDRPEERKYLPRMASAIRHIVVSADNENVLVCTEDNAIQLLGGSNSAIKSTVQHFTYDVKDQTGRSKFPLGLRLNPRTNTLVLNGRGGHLQFYSAYTKNLLYNLRVVDNNIHSHEDGLIVYNTRVTRAAFNINWMATGEVYNDLENFSEVRLKFWEYNEKLQSYILNTEINLPHEQGFKDIIFSNQFQVDNLRCATAGEDNVIKVWGITDSENIYRRGIMWSCLAQTSYRNLPIGAICFSQDGSLLAVGYGNILALYDARNPSLPLHSLSCPPGLDGVVSKAQLRLTKTTLNGARKELIQQRQQLWAILKTLSSSDDQTLVEKAKDMIVGPPVKGQQIKEPEAASKESVYKYIMKMSELSLHQKLQLLRRFGIECSVPLAFQKQLMEHLQRCVVRPEAARVRLRKLDARLHRLHTRHRYKAKHRLDQLGKRRQRYEDLVHTDVMALFSILKLDDNTTSKQPPAKRRHLQATAPKKIPTKAAPMHGLAQISHVQFGAGSQGHLVAVCTESRVLIWNLLTLRLQAGLKLSVRQLAFDPLTNLMAVITRNDELHVFQPNVPLPLYQRRNLPKTHGLAWLPRRQPKQNSINLDWQAQSTLLMLTHTQEIAYLARPGQSPSDDAPAPISFAPTPAVNENLLTHATFGIHVRQQKKELEALENSSGGPLIVGRGEHSAVSAFVNLSAHTMPSMSLICGEFVKSLLIPADATSRVNAAAAEADTNGGTTNGNGLSHEDSDAEDENDEQHEATLGIRKALLERNSVLEEEHQPLSTDVVDQQALDHRLKLITGLKKQLILSM
ncbi:WD repeat-containing protein 75 [Drosophila guanche]|uniref:Blast:WD repeat-containing protein 75 n=1 Tax=Drosophila guanche TaxID=7266 RepID=A0A3B0JIE8_DROGU|nr:WD repeat-containing protein 75 [Drosophila guanche]SPP82137.1 blast:WD repeat-containing protein 75 [Drosophila guanche]